MIKKCAHRTQLEEIRMGAIQAGVIVKTKDRDWREMVNEMFYQCLSALHSDFQGSHLLISGYPV